MEKFCSNCGKELKAGADVCLNCGVMIKTDTKNFNNDPVENRYNVNDITTNNTPGKGLSIAGMVLGIIAAIWSLFTLLSLSEFHFTISIIPHETTEIITLAISFTLYSLIPSLIGIPLSISGLKKQKSGINITGLVLNVISFVVAVIEIVYILSYYKNF